MKNINYFLNECERKDVLTIKNKQNEPVKIIDFKTTPYWKRQQQIRNLNREYPVGEYSWEIK